MQGLRSRGMGLLYGENCIILTSNAFDWSTRVTDRQTDGQTKLPWHIRAIAYNIAVVRKNLGNSLCEQLAQHLAILLNKVCVCVRMCACVQKNVAIPTRSSDDGSVEYSSCEMFALNYSQFNRSQFDSWNRSLIISDDTPVVECSEWTYDQSQFTSTIVSKVPTPRTASSGRRVRE